MGRTVRFIVIAAVVWARSQATAGTTLTPPPPTRTPTASPTEGFHGFRCGNGVREVAGGGLFAEECDDGNLFGGDGCDPFCKRETVSTEVFVAVEEVIVTGRVTFAMGQTTTVRAFEATAVGLAQQGTLCIRGVVPPDQALGPGNVGSGGLSSVGGFLTILDATLYVKRWLNRFPGDQTGADGVPCTEDDPGFQSATTQRQFTLYLRLRPLCDGDDNADGQVTIDEIVGAVNNALNGCPAPVP